MKKAFVIATALILTLSFLTACGVPQTEYDKLNQDLQAAKVSVNATREQLTSAQLQIQELQTDLDQSENQTKTLESNLADNISALSSTKADLSDKEAQISKIETELADVRTQVTSLQSDNEDIKAKLKDGLARVEVLNDVLIPSFNGEMQGMTQAELANYFLQWRDKVIAIGDAELTSKFQAIIDTNGSDAASMEFFIYLLESVPEALGASGEPSSST